MRLIVVKHWTLGREVKEAIDEEVFLKRTRPIGRALLAHLFNRIKET